MKLKDHFSFLFEISFHCVVCVNLELHRAPPVSALSAGPPDPWESFNEEGPEFKDWKSGDSRAMDLEARMAVDGECLGGAH